MYNFLEKGTTEQIYLSHSGTGQIFTKFYLNAKLGHAEFTSTFFIRLQKNLKKFIRLDVSIMVNS